MLQLLKFVVIERIASLARSDLAKDKPARQSLPQLKKLLHWLYTYRVEDRPEIRSLLGKELLELHGNATSGSVDAGNSMGHIAPLLDIMFHIISGFTVTDPSKRQEVDQVDDINLISTLNDIMLPLHRPNEMVLWRDQIPVLQTYHEQLVRCVLKLVEKDRALQLVRGSAVESSVLVLAVQGILFSWPDRFDTNTPKQVLLLHELEMLVEKAVHEEYVLLKRGLLVSSLTISSFYRT